MRVITTKRVKLGSLVLPSDFGKRLKEPRIAERAKSIDAVGLIHEPIVRASDMRVVAGEDRVAAHFALKRRDILCKMVECTDEELKAIQSAENVQRRHDPKEQAQLIAARLDVYEAEVQPVPPDEPRKRGQPKSDRTKARERLAAELGVKAETLRKTEWKAERASPEPKPVECRALGMTLSPEFTAKVGAAQAHIDAADSALRLAQTHLGRLGSDAIAGFPEGRLARLKSDAHDVAVRVRGARPCSLCPWCKGLDGYQEQCPACQATGYITQSQEVSIPRELLDTATPCVMRGGILYMLSAPDAPTADDVWGLE